MSDTPSSPQNVAVRVCLNILNPTETFTPRTVEASLVEISEKSIRIHTESLTREETEQLMETKLVSKIELESPVLDEPLLLKALIFWGKYVVVDEKTPPYSDLGFNFRPPNDEDMVGFRKLLSDIG